MNRSSFICTSVVGTFVLATSALAGGTSTCCSEQATPGCDDPTCQATVCACDPFCCDTQWDALCAGEGFVPGCGAAVLCADLCPPVGGSDCCEVQAGPGCGDEACTEIVCSLEPNCCAVQWDQACVDLALAFCDCEPVGPACPASDHDCFTTGVAGCTDTECCSLVCAADPFCCDTAWDGLCVGGALSLCEPPKCDLECPEGAVFEAEACGDDTNGGCNAPVIGDSTCCSPQATPGCDDPTCQAAVCGADPFCCDTQWDGLCSGAALTLCPDLCATGGTNFEPISCGSTVCGTGWAVGGTRDTDWFELVLGADTEVTFGATASFPFVVGVVDTGGIPDCSLASALNPFATGGPCGTASFTTCLPAGTHWLFVAPNTFDGFPCDSGSNDYVATLECVEGCVVAACGVEGTGDCFVANGTPFCDDEECCLLVCAADPFCCDTAWDGLCADAAANLCVDCEFPACPEGSVLELEACGDDTNGGCNAPVVGDSTCCTPQATPGCDDPTCQAAVCAADPFCCDTQWDGLCSGAALTLCPDLCATGGTNFEPIACGTTVCGTSWATGGTRDTDWFEITFATATEVTFSGSAAFPLVIGIVDTGGVPDCSLASALNPFATAAPCATASFTTCLPAGTHWFFVSVNGFEGFPCGTANDYTVTLTCVEGCEVAGCGSPDTGSCFVANGTPFCDDEACCLLVCGLDPFCCDTAWDQLCADAALVNCGADPIANDNCEDRIEITDGLTAFSTIGATTDGPALPPTCEEGFGLAFVNDVWYNYTTTCAGLVTVSTCASADYDTRLAVYAGTDCSNLVLVSCNDDGPGCDLTSLTTFAALCGDSFKIRVGGFSGSGTGTLSVSCDGVPCEKGCPECPDFNDDGQVDGADLGLLLLNWGACSGCCEDINGDGAVDGADLGLLLLNWGPC